MFAEKFVEDPRHVEVGILHGLRLPDAATQPQPQGAVLNSRQNVSDKL